MKLVAFFIARKSQHPVDSRFLYMTPILCPRSHGESFDIQIKNSDLIFELIFSTLGLILAHNYLNIFFNAFTEVLFLKPYILLVFIYFFTLFLGANLRIVASLFKIASPRIHNQPYLSQSLSEFWGKRWNVWVRNWLGYLGKYLAPKRTYLRYFLIFLISGIFHELMVNLPYFLYTGNVLFGSMIAYFMIQFLGICLDKAFLKNVTSLRYIFMWLVLFAPAPLFMNEAVIRFFGFN